MSNDTMEEEATMRTRVGTFRSGVYLLSAMALSILLAACGGGGGGGTTSSSGTSPALLGPAAVDISIASADVTGSAAPAVAVAGSGTVPSTDPAYLWPEQVTQLAPRIAHVYMEVVQVSLMPSGEAFGGGDGDMEGEMQDGNSPDPPGPADKPGFVTIFPDCPVYIDLLQLENGKRLARFLNKFDHVPAGAYDKIRVYYRNVKVVLADGSTVRFHPTAHSKFDIHFRQGHELVVPETTDTTQPDGWIKFFRVRLDVVGLKIKIVGQGKSWKGCKVILRPQIFAEFDPPILYSVAGTAGNVNKNILPDRVSGTFNVVFGKGTSSPTTVHASFDNNTRWAYSDDVLAGSGWQILDVPNQKAADAFRSDAEVEVIGRFDGGGIFQGKDITLTFPGVASGIADNVWILDNTAFIVRSLTDNVVVIPRPDRATAYYDNLANPSRWFAADQVFSFTDIDNTYRIRARGYFAGEDLSAYWISVAP